jgi:hypothetical protein
MNGGIILRRFCVSELFFCIFNSIFNPIAEFFCASCRTHSADNGQPRKSFFLKAALLDISDTATCPGDYQQKARGMGLPPFKGSGGPWIVLPASQHPARLPLHR